MPQPNDYELVPKAKPDYTGMVPDTRYDEVENRSLPPTVGKLRISASTSRHALRRTAHYSTFASIDASTLSFNVGAKVVFYDRNDPANAKSAFMHRIMRYTEPFKASSEERHALRACALALADILAPGGVPYKGELSAVAAWLSTRNYPLSRRRNLVKSLDRDGFIVDGCLDA